MGGPGTIRAVLADVVGVAALFALPVAVLFMGWGLGA